MRDLWIAIKEGFGIVTCASNLSIAFKFISNYSNTSEVKSGLVLLLALGPLKLTQLTPAACIRVSPFSQETYCYGLLSPVNY